MSAATHQWVLYLAGPVHVFIGEVLEGPLLGVLPDLCSEPTDGRLQILCTHHRQAIHDEVVQTSTHTHVCMCNNSRAKGSTHSRHLISELPWALWSPAYMAGALPTNPLRKAAQWEQIQVIIIGNAKQLNLINRWTLNDVVKESAYCTHYCTSRTAHCMSHFVLIYVVHAYLIKLELVEASGHVNHCVTQLSVTWRQQRQRERERERGRERERERQRDRERERGREGGREGGREHNSFKKGSGRFLPNSSPWSGFWMLYFGISPPPLILTLETVSKHSRILREMECQWVGGAIVTEWESHQILTTLLKKAAQEYTCTCTTLAL